MHRRRCWHFFLTAFVGVFARRLAGVDCAAAVVDEGIGAVETVGAPQIPRRDSAHKARQLFYRHMQPHMREMEEVRAQLREMRAEIARRHDETPPSALLAHAMHMEHERDVRDANDRVSEGIENVRMINEPISDFMYQGDMLLDARQTAEMALDMQRERVADAVDAVLPRVPAFRYPSAAALRRQAAERYDEPGRKPRRLRSRDPARDQIQGKSGESADKKAAEEALKRLLNNDDALEKAFDAALNALERGRALKAAQTQRRRDAKARIRAAGGGGAPNAQPSHRQRVGFAENDKKAHNFNTVSDNFDQDRKTVSRRLTTGTAGYRNSAAAPTRRASSTGTVAEEIACKEESLVADTVNKIANAVANRLHAGPFDSPPPPPLVARAKRQAQTGRNFPRNQWDPSVPIPYYFDASLGAEARRVVRMAVQFWTENTCVTFAENGAGFPRVRFFAGGGCFSQVGKAFHSTEQMISIGKGCEQFGIAAHEIGHTLGFFHGQARNDRDDFVSIVYSNLSPAMATQFAKQSPDNNYNYGIKYDYGSVMHYSDTDSTTNRVTMLAKEKIYQHTMGNNVQPSFLDVFEMNIYYRCIENCATGADCKHGGYRHPHNCNACICPSGFGGADCSENPLPENGPPVNCGRSVEATEDFQALTGSVSASSDLGLADRHATCYWHIRAPEGMRVEIRVRSLSGACADGCFYGGIEIKTRDFQRVGARICCRSDIRQLGILFTDTELAIVGAFSQYKKQTFTVIYRSVSPDEVPAEGYSSYPLDAKNPSLAPARPRDAPPTTVGGAVGSAVAASCVDVATNCYSLLALCDVEIYRELMTRQCRATCMRCDIGAPRHNVLATADSTDAFCSRDHENCPAWTRNGFCASAHYSAQVKREICPRSCNLC